MFIDEITNTRYRIKGALLLSIRTQTNFERSRSKMNILCKRLQFMYLTYLILAICCTCALCADDVCQVFQPRLNEKFFCPQIPSTLVFDNITKPECVTYCMYKKCAVISYNSFEQICLLDKTPCHLLQPNKVFYDSDQKDQTRYWLHHLVPL